MIGIYYLENVYMTLLLSPFSTSANVYDGSGMMTSELRDDRRLSLLVSSPLMKVLMPVIVARGISGNPCVSSLSERSFLRRRHAAAI